MINTDEIFKKSELLYNKQKYDKAIIELNKLISLDLYNPRAYCLMGICYYKKERYEEALVYYNKAISIDENYSAPYINKGFIYVKMNNYDAAMESYNKAKEIDCNNKYLFWGLGFLHFKQKNYEESKLFYKKAIEKDSLYKDAYFNLGLVYKSQKKYKEAIRCFDEVIKIDNNYNIAYFQKSNIYEKLDKQDAALEEYIKYKDKNFYEYINDNLKDKQKINILKLAKTIIKLKEILIYNDTKSIGHYTKINNLKYLIKPIENNNKDNYPKLRLNNVAYMNDPTEGEVFKDLLKENIAEEKIDIINKLYDIDDTNEREILPRINNTFLASFSKSIDNSLPMWVQYTNNGQGCCLIFDFNFFDKQESCLMKVNDNVFDKEIDAEECYCLYEIKYMNRGKDNKYFVPYKIKEHLKNVVDMLVYLEEDIINNIKIREIILNLLDQVRYLFKSKDYEHEQEVRIIKFSNEVKFTGDTEGYRVPHVYIDMERELEIDEVILGPKVSEPMEIANYLYYTGKVDKVTKSKIKYK